jgi:hypothetical protein
MRTRVMGFLLLFCVLSIAPLRAADIARELREAPRRPPGDEDRCLVCGDLVKSESGFVLEIRGRLIPVGLQDFDILLAEPQRYLSQLSMNGAWFQEAWGQEVEPTNSWLAWGLLMLGGVLFGGLAGHLALQKGLPPGVWFITGFILNILALLLLTTQKGKSRRLSAGMIRLPKTVTPVACTGCGSFNHPTAAACACCCNVLEPSSESEIMRALPVHP